MTHFYPRRKQRDTYYPPEIIYKEGDPPSDQIIVEPGCGMPHVPAASNPECCAHVCSEGSRRHVISYCFCVHPYNREKTWVEEHCNEPTCIVNWVSAQRREKMLSTPHIEDKDYSWRKKQPPIEIMDIDPTIWKLMAECFPEPAPVKIQAKHPERLELKT